LTWSSHTRKLSPTQTFAFAFAFIMAASNGEQVSAGAGDDAAKPPPNVTIPPKDIRDNVVKAVEFLVRRGVNQERDLIERVRAKGLPNMVFMLPEDQYNPYYRWALDQGLAGKGPGAPSQQQVQETKPQGPPKPADFRFSARMPNINAKDLEILKLTALYRARAGERFLTELRHREAGNFQFEFLRANHSFFPFFNSLVEQYKILIEEESTVEARIEELQHNIKDRFHILDRAKSRAEYVKYTTQQKEKLEKKLEDEKKEFQMIDWHDFGVIATVLFDEADDAAELPAPESLANLQSASLEQKAAISLNTKRIDEAMPDDVTYYNASQQHAIPTPSYSAMPPPGQASYAPMPSAPADYRTDAQRRQEEEARAAQAERDRAAQAQAAARGAPGSMKIRTDYVPKGKKANVPMNMCPNCKQSFPADEIAEHIRIELLDPSWKEQREKTQARYSTVINPSEAANNLKRFASQREDIYDGVTGMPISEEEVARRKKAATSYDGQPDPAKDAARVSQMATMNVQEQLRRIQERHGGGQ
jgi:splicing factor 3A subunit 1